MTAGKGPGVSEGLNIPLHQPEERSMTVSKQARGSPDSKRIDINDAYEVRNCSKSFGVSGEKLKEAVWPTWV